MKKKDLLIIIGLFLLWFAWGPFDRHVIKPLFPEAPPAPTEPVAETTSTPEEPSGITPSPTPGDEASKPEPPAEPEPVEPVEVEEPVVEKDVPEKTAILANDKLEVTVSTRGGSIHHVLVKSYPQKNEEGSGPVELDFSSRRALGLQGIPGLSENYGFTMEAQSDGRKIVFRREVDGLEFQRRMTLGDGYVLEVEDQFLNRRGKPVELPVHRVQSGHMRNLVGESSTYGIAPLGVDSLSPGEKVTHWGKKLVKATKNREVYHEPMNKETDWVATKNKYFVQTIVPETGGSNFHILAVKDPETKMLKEVASSVQFASTVLGVDGALTRNMNFYVGPKKLAELKAQGIHQNRIMELGWFAVIGEFLLGALNLIYKYVWPHNYGVAIMLLTIIIRIIFWPITHKGTESMRRMQELAPAMNEINQKYKDSPEKRQQALMAFYKENKINPLGGCLPMVIQIPVFIGLFYVLRSAIELRYAPFLWISDLSEPERIIEFGFKIPIVGWDALNILPIVMVITMIWQQKLTPTAASGGDPRQQQMQQTMMKVMPIMMLFILYNFAAGLALYWSTQNILMIVQQLLYKRKRAAKAAAEDRGEAAS